MTPDELDAIEAAWKDPYQHPNAVECPPALIAALREAWAAQEPWAGYCCPPSRDEWLAVKAERDELLRKIDAVRGLCDEAEKHGNWTIGHFTYRSVPRPAFTVEEVRAAIDGETT